jgi:hypothetical protein
MTGMNWERLARASGIGFVALLIVGFLLFGDAPKVDASGSEVAAFYSDHSGRVLTAIPIIGIAFLLLLWFAGAVANILRAGGEDRLAGTALAIAAALVGLQFGVQALGEALSMNVAEAGDEGVLQALNTISWTADAFGAFLIAAFIAASTVGLRRVAVVPRWFGLLGLVAGVLVALRGTTLASDGFWSPSGGYLYIFLLAAFGWTIVASVLLYRAAPAAEPTTPERAVMPTG